MEDGQFRVGAIIQARLGSTRLPNKVMLPLPIGSTETILSTIIKSLTSIKLVDEIVVATSKKTVNDKLESYTRSLGTICFRGEENDVLSRFYHVIKAYKLDFVIRFTGDNPIIDKNYLKEFIEYFLSNNLDYAYSKNLPLGCNFEMIKASEILFAHAQELSSYEREHVTPYIRENAKKSEAFVFRNFRFNDNIRLTVDYPSDYAFVQMLYSLIKSRPISLVDLVSLLEEKPWLLKINNENFQKIEYKSLDDEIKNILPTIIERGMLRLDNLLRNKLENKNH